MITSEFQISVPAAPTLLYTTHRWVSAQLLFFMNVPQSAPSGPLTLFEIDSVKESP